MILVKPVLILVLSIVCSSQIFAVGSTDFAALLTTGGKAALEYKQQSKQFEQQKKEQQSKLNEINAVTNKQAAMSNMTSPYGTGATPPVAAAGYPLTDPYANPQYWSQRGQQFKFSMDVASKRSETMNDMAKIQLEQEKQKQQMMMEGVGTLMKSAGGLMGQMAADKKAEELKIASDLEAKQKADEKRSFDRETLVIEQDRIKKEVVGLETRLENESDPDKRKALIVEIEAARTRETQAGYKVEDFDRQNPPINFDNNKTEEETTDASEESTTTNEESTTTNNESTTTNNEGVEPEQEVGSDESEPASSSEQSSSADEAAQGS